MEGKEQVTHWYALMTKPQRELRAANDLRDQGATVFVPVEIVLRKARTARGSKLREANRLLAPGYVFTTDPHADCDDIRGVLMIDGRPIAISEAAMLPLMEATGRMAPEYAPRASFSIGDLVRVTAGPFAGHTVTIAKVSKGRLHVVCRLFGTDTEAAIKPEMVEAA